MKREDYSQVIFLIFAELLFAVFLLICCGGLIYFNANETSPDQLFLVCKEFMPSTKSWLRPEIRERTTFIYLTLLSLPVCFVMIYIFNLFRNVKKQTDARAIFSKTILLNSIILIIMLVCFYQPNIKPQFMYLLFDPVWDKHILLCLALALSLTAIYALFELNLNKCCGKFLFPLLLLIPLMQILCSRIYILNLISNEVPFHPNIIAYALSQAAAGCTDYHQYGFYQRMLAPLFRVIPPNMLNISVVMAFLFIAGCLSLYWVLFRCVKNISLIPAFALVLFLTTGTWLFLDRERQSSIEPYFAYYPVRFIFPALSVLFFYCLIFLRKKYTALFCGILAGIGLWWNIDSGVAVFGAFFVAMGLELIFSKERLSALKQFLSFCISALFAFLALLIIFSIQQGCIISPAESLKYVKIFSSTGFMMIPMPGLPAPWCFFAGIYLLGIIIGLRLFISGQFTVLAKMSLFLSVLGTGLFTYYQGRSHIWSLPTVIWPALILMFIYTDRIIRLVKGNLINGAFKMLVFPVAFFTTCSIITIVCGSGMIATGIERTCRGIMTLDEVCPLEQNIRFILANAGENKIVNIVSDMQGVYYAETGLRSGIANFGMVELFFIKDWARIGTELREAKVPMFVARSRHANWMYKYYKLEAVSKDGSLMYFTPIVKLPVKINTSVTRS